MTSTAGHDDGRLPVVIALDADSHPRWINRPTVASGACEAWISGLLHDRTDLRRELGLLPEAGDTEIAAAAFARWGDDCLTRLRGQFMVALHDARAGRTIVGRDPMGIHPLFYAIAGARLFCASTPQQIVSAGGARAGLNRAAIADALCRRHPNPEETYFESVRRLPAGAALVVKGGSLTTRRVWAPGRKETAARLAVPEAFEIFETLQEQSVRRSVAGRPAAILLSGGLDSTTIAAVAAELARHARHEPPLALCLGFADPSCDERALQKQVADTLTLPAEHLLFDDAVPAGALLQASLALAAHLPGPLVNLFGPAYEALVARARGRVHAVLTGNGGDEWLSVSGYAVADLLRALRFAELRRFRRAWHRAYGDPPSILRFGVRAFASAAMQRTAGGWWTRDRARRLLASDPAWVAPDAALRREQEARAPLAFAGAGPGRSFALSETLRNFEAAYVALELEEYHALGARHGVVYEHPYLDPDLVEFCCSLDPAIPTAGGELKGLLRLSARKRLPAVPLADAPKVLATRFFRKVYFDGFRAAWASYGDLRGLGSLGIVDPALAAASALREGPAAGKIRSWDLLNVEAWVRAQLEGVNPGVSATISPEGDLR